MLLIKVITTSLTPGARLITRKGLNARKSLNTLTTPKIFGESEEKLCIQFCDIFASW